MTYAAGKQARLWPSDFRMSLNKCLMLEGIQSQRSLCCFSHYWEQISDKKQHTREKQKGGESWSFCLTVQKNTACLGRGRPGSKSGLVHVGTQNRETGMSAPSRSSVFPCGSSMEMLRHTQK